ncbi:MAG: UDP-N-acetylmuramate dehydrogenase [Cryomorphaceae bacterium]|jgi:UDP-N-acetylmuramate dehydrogenase|nr:UDP-N-acetylmuramate dehydrogenase [Cryomorphaceae bacterium]MDG1889608.1 UDP-N-acetylmuramate dehydrogenase [Flavobacteriaceae bacterium]MBT3503867.1 UDP-N-acetylmuramate dehydrogenase [Cryomorphaceae bacterium]MBT3689095.1 UDP-N-acetylmuramate dehydrogenase [Cryomorphaceae bacterium]MBT4222637.1 UDP-N-acetylmuramate dehydrogenase [Cryomorphaceae bacterium]
MKVHRNASLKNFNTFNVDEKARILFEINNISDLSNILSKEAQKDEILVLGGGSNILFTKSFDGIIINIKNRGIKLIEEDENTVLVEVSAGENWHDFVLWAVKNNFGGIENLSLIPGNVGAAPIQNIGAYGVELKDIFHSCRGVMLDSLNEFELTKSECEFDYRSSIFKSKFKNKIIITSVQFILTKSRHNFNINYNDLKINLVNTELTIKKISDEVIRIRKSKLPDPKSFGNCGSFFKNPIVNISRYKSLIDKFPKIPCHKINKSNYKISAAWLIDQSGFKNKKDKKVGVYVNQPLVIINHGNASGRDLLNLANNIKETIYSNFEIELEEEVLII